ncbi:PBP1A family penicillin-binding protein [Thermovirga lienii]|uniref:PBP1A family penicillin-binding protein n=1 Tax=Thermovirga lienii TaxID=336261 RepID=UPI002FE1F3B0
MSQKGDKDRKNRSKSSKKKRSLLGTVLYSFLVVILLASAVVAVVGSLYIRSLAASLPTSEEIARYEPDLSTIVYDRHNRVITKLFRQNRTWVNLEDIPVVMRNAVIAAEDSEFYKHKGVDFSAIIRAFWKNVTSGRVEQGASTITQQLARNMFLTQEKTLARKIKEAILAVRLEQTFSKERILEMYLNVIYFGHGAWGIHSACQLYFNKEPKDLTLSEATLLAGIIKAPEYYSPKRHPKRAAIRQAYVLRRMVELGMISPQDAERAKKIQLDFQGLKKPSLMFDSAPYFISYILFDHLLPKYGSDLVYRGGLRVYTTIDLDIQRAAEEAIQNLKSEGAIVALDPYTGEILALVGGKDFNKSKFNRATQAYRQPGSAFKPFVYAAALEKGLRPIDHVFDAPLSFDNGVDENGEENIWSPGNYGGTYHGEVTILEALVHSYNTVAVRVGQITGIQRILNLARDAGFTSPHIPADLSVALGSASITPLELASAYCIFANDGFRVQPFGIRKVTTAAGEVLESFEPLKFQAVPPQITTTIRSMMEEVVRSGTGRRAKIEGYEVFGKTGTTNEYSDAWFAGGIPNMIAVVYAGNDDHTSLGKAGTGGTIAAPVWHDFVSKAKEYIPIDTTFPDTSTYDVVEVKICRETGFLAGDSCPSASILMPVGTTPETVCPIHGGGSWEAAALDPNSPKLLLSPKDQETLGVTVASAPVYSIAPPEGTEEQIVVQTPYIAPPSLDRPIEMPEEPTPKPKAPLVPKVETRPKERTPEEIDKRFRELLKQYGITE